ncbi:methionine--tRNA ligase, cytoplasmic [Condylostylus longicornis]|uniref:methionine--tRNA ligase, cytoplasmic n=1 Tax=Condylostylus longicornis TaxID=2530218 RepID=UPI00244E165B|nr:methionine--tRNA ligase, cytoplasmic [Condylostylus longicornis]
MIIYTNEGNPFGLKLLLLVKFAGKEAVLKKVNLNDPAINAVKQLPILELDSGKQLFSTDAAARFLFPKEGNTDLRNQWLEWSTILLAPALAHNMGVGHRADPNALPLLNFLVKKLDDRLQESPFLAGEKITSADLSVWSLLAPDGTLKNAQNIDNLINWYRKIKTMKEVEEILKIQPLNELSFGSLKDSNKFGGLHHIVLPHIDDQSSILAETNRITETISNEEFEIAKDSFIFVDKPETKEPRTVLPKKNERNVLITSALPYVNNVPHLGNIIGCVLSADIFARYSRLCGYNTLYICGTDEYGTATENKALAENLTPKEICDKYFELHNAIYRWFGIGFDYFGRTTTKEQTEVVQNAFEEINRAGFIQRESVEQLLCQKCDRFLADRFVEGTCPHPGCGYEDARGDQCDKCGKLVNATELIRPRCKVCNTTPVIKLSEQLFLDLPKIEPKLHDWVEISDVGWTHNAKVITRSWLKEGLKPRCITRDLKWGIPVPLKGFESKVFYVWFDAPYGYVSITKRYTKEYLQWWQPNNDVKVELFQFMAKDNVPFHSVMFPASLLAIDKGHTLVSHIMATEYLNYEDGKFSKSRGIGVFGNDAQDTGIPADIWRFYLACARPEGQDSSFSWNDLGARNNSDLLNNLGNFVNRAAVFCEKNFNSQIPQMNLTNEEIQLLALVNREIKGYVHSLEKARLRDGIRHILSVSRHGNQYMQSQQPWVLIKGTDDQKSRAATIIGICCNLSATLGALLFPYMPNTARTIFDQLNVKQWHIEPDSPVQRMILRPGHKIGKPAPLFAKIEQTRIDELKKKFGGVQTSENNSIQKSEKTKMQFTTIAEAEEAIKIQGDKVRTLKTNKVEKAVWQPEVDILLELKKQLAVMQQSQVSNGIAPQSKPSTTDKPSVSADKVKELEEKIAKQGEKVRELKAAGDASVWKPEVEILLAFKKELSTLTGVPEPATGKSKKKK